MSLRKIIDMPEEQYLGALERAVESLSIEVAAALTVMERERDWRARADEALVVLGGQGRGASGGGSMGFGVGERPERSLGVHLDGVGYPADREEIVQTAEENEAPAEVINFLKSLPRDRYDTEQMVWRDLAEAARRFGMGGHAPLVGSIDRRNLGRDAVEENVDGNPRHP
jgi:hypothetical protein